MRQTSHLIHVDDILIFAKAYVGGAIAIKEVFEEFYSVTRLQMNAMKLSVFFGGDVM